MVRRLGSIGMAGWLLCISAVLAQEGIQRGKIKKVEPDKNLLVISSGEKDLSISVTKDARFMDGTGKPMADRLADKRLRPGTAVMFKTVRRDAKLVLLGVKLAPSEVDLSKLKPLTELGKDTYQGWPGGLYPEGKNERPAAHEKAGLALARRVQPLDTDGKPARDGKIVLLSVGMSNTTQEFSMFQKLANKDEKKNPRLILVDGAQGGMTAAAIQDACRGPGKKFWDTVDERLQKANASRAQVQIAWLKEADAGPTTGFPAYARTLHEELARIVQLMHRRFPNLKMVYLSSRIFAGYASTTLNPEPYAYESGFAVKWLIEQQIKGAASLNYDPDKGEVKAPWLSWGPYLWANGTNKRRDGLFYEAKDFSGDGTHPSAAGRRKVAEQLLKFFHNDSTTKTWFLAPSGVG